MPSENDHDASKKLTSSQACQIYLAEWKSGQSRPLEELLDRVVPADRSQAFRSLLIMEFRRRMEAGEKPTDKDYLRRFPGEMSIIGEVLEMFPTDSSKDTNQGEPFEITGYGSDLASAMAAIRSNDGIKPPTTKSKSGDRIPQLPNSSSNKAPDRESPSKNKEESAYGNRLADPPEYDDAPRSKRTQPRSSGTEPTEEIVAHIAPEDLANLVVPEGGKKGRKPIMKLVIDWATSSAQIPSPDSNSNQEMSPDSLYKRLTAKSIVTKSPLSKPHEAPKVKLKRASSSDPEQEIEEEQNESQWKDNPILLIFVGAFLVCLILVSLWVFIGSSVQPIEQPPALNPNLKKAAPKDSPVSPSKKNPTALETR